jgi:hypothetical protein
MTVENRLSASKRRTRAEVQQLVVYARYNENFVLVVTSGCCIRWDSTGYQGRSPWLVSLRWLGDLCFPNSRYSQIWPQYDGELGTAIRK